MPAKLSARARLFSTGQGRKTDPVDAHSVALAGLHSPGLRVITADDATVALRLLADRRDELGTARTQTVNRLHRLLLELFPGGAKKFLSAAQAKELLATVRPRDIVGKTRRRLAAELITELALTGKRIKAADAELKELVTATCGCREPHPRHATRRYSLIRLPVRACLRTRYCSRSTGRGGIRCTTPQAPVAVFSSMKLPVP